MSEFLNNEDESLAAAMERWLRRATVARWAVAYIRTSIIDRLSGALSDFEARGGMLQILTGSGQHFTQAEALERLKSIGGVEIKVYSAPGVTFHPKLYLFRDGMHGAIVGSANLSASALASNIEVAAEITHVTDPAFVIRADEWFDSVWQRAVPLNATLIEWFRINERNDDEEDFHRLVREQRTEYGDHDTDRFVREALFRLGHRYANEQLSANARVSTQGGIRYRGSTRGTIERCIIITASEKGEFYKDEADHVRGYLRYTGEGRSGDQALTRGNRVLALQSTGGFPLHVFQKEAVNQYLYLGQYRVTDVSQERQVGEDGEVRSVFVFEMQRLQ